MKKLNVLKKYLCAAMAVVMLAGLTACGGNSQSKEEVEEPAAEETPVEEETPADTGVTMRVAAMTGPTGMGLVKLMALAGTPMTEGTDMTTLTEAAMADSGSRESDYTFSLAGTADEISPLLIKGELDAACVPANLASVLYSKTEGNIVSKVCNLTDFYTGSR